MHDPATGGLTWAICPVCREKMAIAWDRTGEVPIEFDCVNECPLTVADATQAAAETRLRGPRRGPINGRP